MINGFCKISFSNRNCSYKSGVCTLLNRSNSFRASWRWSKKIEERKTKLPLRRKLKWLNQPKVVFLNKEGIRLLPVVHNAKYSSYPSGIDFNIQIIIRDTFLALFWPLPLPLRVTFFNFRWLIFRPCFEILNGLERKYLLKP